MGTPTRATFENYSGSAADNYERYFVPTIGLPSARPLLRAAALREGERVLDVACGTGVAAHLAAEAVGPTGRVTGVDLNPGMIEVARRSAPAGTPIEWHQGDAEDLPLPDESFDVVLCAMGIQFFQDKIRALKEFRRVLVPGGRVVLSAPGPTPPLFQAIDDVLVRHIGPEASMFVNVVFSVHDSARARDMLQAAGFDGVDVESDPVSLRLPPPADFFWQYVHSTPLSAIASRLDDRTKAALEAEIVDRCEAFVDGGSLVMNPNLLVARGHREPAEGRKS